MAQERNILGIIWRNFIKSFSVGKRKGDFMGKDHLGTSYFEIPADPQRGKRRPSRWFETVTDKKEKFDQELPPEWEAWLRGRREKPPMQEEINVNMAVAHMKKIKAAELEAKEKGAKSIPEEKILPKDSKKEYPRYDEYESLPGVPSENDKKT